MRPECLTVNEAAALLGLKPQIIWNGIHRNALPVDRLKSEDGRERVVIAKDDLLAWVAARERKVVQRAQRQHAREQKESRRQSRAPRDPSKPRPGTKARCHRHSSEWGELLKRTRENLGLSISEVGRRADTCQSYVSRMEGLGEIPRREKVLAITRALDADPNPFLVVCGYAPEETTQLAQLVQSLSALQPEEQNQALSLLRAWREAPESERRQWGHTNGERSLLAG